MKKLISLLILVVAAPAALAASQRVTLSVPGMTCSACPIVVKMALTGTPGVSKVNIFFEKREATVVFDDNRTNILKLTRATEEAGYPSSVKR